MAGIGFSLQKILGQDSLARTVAAYATAGIVSSGPWIISILSIMAFGVYYTVSSSQHLLAMQFQMTVTYLVAASLIFSGFAQNSFARYLADQLYLNRIATVLPHLNGMILCLSALGGVVVITLLAFFFPDQSLMYRFCFLGAFICLSILWVVIHLLTSLKDYRIIFIAFLLSYTLILLLGYLLRSFGLEGMMFSYFLGQVVLLCILIVAIYRQYPSNQFIGFDFLQKKQMYQSLVWSGVLFSAAIWIDKIVFWYAPDTGYAVLGPLHASLVYDAPIFIAYLTAVPGMGVLLFLIETRFSDYYMRFHEAIRDGKTLAYIQKMRDQMISHAYNVILSIIKIQAVMIVLVFQLGEPILNVFHLSLMYKNLLFIDVIGTSLQVLCLAILNLMYYIDRKKDALILSALFLVLNFVFSIISIYLGPFFYGLGFTVALLLVCCYGIHRLDIEFSELDYQLIMLGR